MKTSASLPPDRWRRRFYLLMAIWLCSLFLMSFRPIRGFVATPLFVHDEDAAGDAAYVMADGYAYWERLRAAADLYHMKRVPRIIILDEQRSDGFNFTRHQSETRLERAVDYLSWHGVPRTVVSTVRVEGNAALGSLSEARAVASQAKGLNSLQRLVVVTSAPHTRRSRLCFRRALPEEIEVQVYAASPLSQSAETDAPIWIEYVKLLVYMVAA